MMKKSLLSLTVLSALLLVASVDAKSRCCGGGVARPTTNTATPAPKPVPPQETKSRCGCRPSAPAATPAPKPVPPQQSKQAQAPRPRR